MKGKIGCFILLLIVGFSVVPIESNYRHELGNTATRPLDIGPIPSEMTFSTYIDGWNDDTIDSIVVDALNNTYIAGRTRSGDLPSGGNLGLAYSGGSDYYVMKLNASQDIEYLTYIGAEGYEGSPNLSPLGACSIDVDSSGRVYMTGTTDSYYFPISNPSERETEFGGFGDCFALRLSPTGDSLQYSYFLAGNNFDIGTSIKVDVYGYAYICGWTKSSNFPIANAFDSTLGGNADLFLLKLDGFGHLVYSTYVGGSNLESTETTSSLFVDEQRNAYIIGKTNSPNLHVSNHDIEYNDGSMDLFFWKVSSNGDFISGSYFGGPDNDRVGGIYVDDLGDIYLTGSTSGAIPSNYSIGTSQNAFVTKFTNAGSFIRTTSFGGSDTNYPLSIFVNDEHCAFISGYTYSSNFPLEAPLEDTYDGLGDCFVAKLSSDGDRFLFSSYLGGNDTEEAIATTLTPYNSIVIGGVSNSSDFESVNSSIIYNQQLYGFLVELEDDWEDTPLVTPTTTTSTTTTTTTSLPTTTTTTSSSTSGSTAMLDTILLIGLGIELIILFLMVQHIFRNMHRSPIVA